MWIWHHQLGWIKTELLPYFFSTGRHLGHAQTILHLIHLTHEPQVRDANVGWRLGGYVQIVWLSFQNYMIIHNHIISFKIEVSLNFKMYPASSAKSFDLQHLPRLRKSGKSTCPDLSGSTWRCWRDSSYHPRLLACLLRANRIHWVCTVQEWFVKHVLYNSLYTHIFRAHQSMSIFPLNNHFA